MGPSGKKGCFDCSQLGESISTKGSIQYKPFIVMPLRTDEAFKSRLDTLHHHSSHHEKEGALESIGLNMVTDFPICAMHTVDLGVMKKILSIVIVEKGFGRFKFTKNQLAILSKSFVELRERTVLEMARYPRELVANSKHLKATECRGILLYYGMVIFKPIMNQDMYEHFLCLCVGIRILADPSANEYGKQIAQKVLEKFVGNFSYFYGLRLSFVVHMLLHLKQYVDLYGPLYDFSAYEFENHLRDVKEDVHFHNKVIEQIQRRSTERGFLKFRETKKEGLSRPLNDGSFSQLVTKTSILRCDGKNCFGWIRDGELIPVMFEKFIQREDGRFVHFRKLKSFERPFFEIKLNNSQSISSKMIGVAYCKNECDNEVYETTVTSIAYKGMLLPFEENIVLIPLLHEN